ncbi:hypothetical protein [Accumulibacter sp.]|uniref:hypothetical protein n=1 Tax=Accumulibacter sp. TaxID=2053492 RepID=UPI002613C21E|nr:hypothetical protein [Accumulibacter sp.]
MNANKLSLAQYLVAVALCASTGAAFAVQNLNAASQTKVNNAMAKAWQKGGNPNDPALQKRVVNIGSKRAGTCDVNVGTVQPGQRAPKDIVVTTKEVINVCK